jgi:hypothetical protein
LLLQYSVLGTFFLLISSWFLLSFPLSPQGQSLPIPLHSLNLLFLRWGLTVFPTLVSNSWAQAILLPKLPK